MSSNVLVAKNIKDFALQIPQEEIYTYVDVGAMGGVSRKWNALIESIQIIGFDPDERDSEKFKKGQGMHFLNYALYEHSTDLSFYITKEARRSSLYPPNDVVLAQFPQAERFKIDKIVPLSCEKVKALEWIAREYKINCVDFMKIDTQGSELSILKGASALFPSMWGIEVEVEFLELYRGQPLFRDVDSFLSSQGFQLIDLRRVFWKRNADVEYFGKGQLVFADALYLKTFEALSSYLHSISQAELRLTKIRKIVLTALIYRLFDYAQGVVSLGLKEGFLDTSQAEAFKRDIKSISSQGSLPDFLGRTQIYKALQRIASNLIPPSYLGFADSDRLIGNGRNI